jgi:hypothetical protein
VVIDPHAGCHRLAPTGRSSGPLSRPPADFYDNRIGQERKKCNHIRQLEALDYKVTLEPCAVPKLATRCDLGFRWRYVIMA